MAVSRKRHIFGSPPKKKAKKNTRQSRQGRLGPPRAQSPSAAKKCGMGSQTTTDDVLF